MINRDFLKRGATVLCTVLLLSAPTVRAAETIRMIAADSYSQSALWVRVFIDYYMPEVDRRLAETGNYEIDWNPAFGGTVAKTKQVLESLQYDIADIGIITTPYHPDKVPFYNLPYATPFVTNDIGLIARTMSDLSDKYPELKTAWEDYGLKYLVTAGSIDTYNIILREDLESLDDLRGQKIGGVGSNLLFLEGSGAVGVSSGLSEWYNNMATRLMSGTIVWPEAIAAYKLYEVGPYMLDVQFGGATSKAIVVNGRTWERLPEEVRVVLQDVANDYRDHLALETDRISAHAKEVFEREGGQTIPLTEEQRREWAENLPNLADDWVVSMEKKGLPGRAILEDYMQAMRDNNQPIMRQWDQ